MHVAVAVAASGAVSLFLDGRRAAGGTLVALQGRDLFRAPRGAAGASGAGGGAVGGAGVGGVGLRGTIGGPGFVGFVKEVSDTT